MTAVLMNAHNRKQSRNPLNLRARPLGHVELTAIRANRAPQRTIPRILYASNEIPISTLRIAKGVRKNMAARQTSDRSKAKRK